MAKDTLDKEVAPAPIVLPHGLDLDDDCTAIASDDVSVTVERAGKKFKVTASQHPAVDWDWLEIV